MDPFSIIIPACNEEKNIERCLENLVRPGTPYAPATYEIIVVCNGCTDETALLTRKFTPHVLTLETETASKTTALQMGDDAARYFPRVYLDADVEMSSASIINLAKSIRNSGMCAMSPVVENDLSQSSHWVRSFYNVWKSLSYYREGLMGAGVYCLSEKGRARFLKWPELISDDGYIRVLFSPEERSVCKGSSVQVYAPRTLIALLQVKTRSRLGGYQLARAFPDLCRRERAGKHYGKSFAPFIRRPHLWFDCLVYVLINTTVRIRARWQLRYLQSYRWARDLSTR